MGKNIRNSTGNSIPGGQSRNYLSDEALQELIAGTEAEPLLCPPKGFRDEIIGRIHRKKEHMKKVSLFSYSMKVIAATAAALSLILIVPENIRPEENSGPGAVQGWLEEAKEQDLEEAWTRQNGFLYRFSSGLDEACSRLNGRLNQLVGTEGYY
ncbi:MAG: hypothetical protein NC341_03555 [Blautia sp.]|nr:hypothetical protein [Blautia sp.]